MKLSDILCTPLRTFFIFGLILTGRLLAPAQGIPEPSVVFYGVIRNQDDGDVRLNSGVLNWRIRSALGGDVVTLKTELTNLNDQYSYVLRVPCEYPVSGYPASPNTIQLLTIPMQYTIVDVEVDGHAAALSLTDLTLSILDRGRLERVDMTVAFVPEDSDNDELPDAWECRFFDCDGHPFLDDDNDGLTNLAEYRAGTDPTDPQSVFAFIDIQTAPEGGVLLLWSSAAGRHYTVLRSDDPATGFAILEAELPATAPVNTFHDESATGEGPYFYRLLLDSESME